MVVVPMNVMWGQKKRTAYEPDVVPADAPRRRPSFWQWVRAWYLKWRQPSDIAVWNDRIDQMESDLDDVIVNMLAKKGRRR